MSNDPCDDCGESPCECDHLRKLIEDVSSVIEQLDRLAELWGDEGVFRRCRDGLRAALKRAEKGGGGVSDEIRPCPACKGDDVRMRVSTLKGCQYVCKCGVRGPLVPWVRDDDEATWAAAVAAWNAMSRESSGRGPEPLTDDEIRRLADRVVSRVEWSQSLDQPRDRVVSSVADTLAEMGLRAEQGER